jgi:hypothetical protein
MFLLADINLGDIIWSMFLFFFFVIFLWMIFAIITDIFRSKDMGGVTKAIWCIALVIVPWLMIFIYLIVRGNGMGERAMAAHQSQQAAFDQYVQQTAGAAGPSGEIANAKALLDAGTISQEEFDSLKAAALAKTSA